ncbi:hypothetical protein [Georgenia faecalis]|uniref:hypothetical protein n=1 Tax=Georgenia faecalis TaxID=2483799 RepID=UPI000FD98A99|nr:hypothetical protein [Georgenia faecalis]
MNPTTTSVAIRDVPGAPAELEIDAHEGLRRAVAHMSIEGWDSLGGTWLMAQLEQRSRGWAAKIDHRCGRRAGTTVPDDVLEASWSTIMRFPEKIVSAEAPWAYLWTAVGNALAVDITAESMLSSCGARSGKADRPDRVLRIGLEVHHLDAASVEASEPAPSLSPGVRALIRILADCHRDRVAFWTDAVDRALDVMADARRSYEETALRRDPYLLERLGFTPEELSALAALLIGPRRGDRASQSLLLALRRDPATPIDSVAGAARRVHLLRAHGSHPRRFAWPPAAA